jgi:hypothetical protein
MASVGASALEWDAELSGWDKTDTDVSKADTDMGVSNTMGLDD